MEAARIAIVGATGLVGREILTVLDERQFPLSEVRLYSSQRSAGEQLEVGGRSRRVDLLDSAQFDDVDLVFLAAGETVTAETASKASDAGAVVIDISQIFSDDIDVPLIVPEINSAELAAVADRRLVASPDAVAIPAAIVLNPLREAAGVRRVVITTFEAVSWAGQGGIDELQRETIDLLSGRSTAPAQFAERIAFNALPHIGQFLAGGSTRHELLTVNAIRRVLDYPELPVSVTRVCVPMFFGQAIALNVETEQSVSADAARELLREAPGILLQDAIEEGTYPTPADAVSNDSVSVGRIRSDEDSSTLDLWITSDNLRKGAAVNAVQIAEILVRQYL